MDPSPNPSPGTHRKEHRSLWWRSIPFAAIFLVVALVLYRLTIKGEALFWGDLLLYFYPLEHVVQEALRSGRIPLWNPYVYCGQPLVGNPQSWVLYPTTILLFFIPVWLYFTVNTVLHLLAAGLGFYLFLRRICGDRTGAVLGAITYAGSGFVVGRLQFPTMVQSAAYLPWILLLIDRIIERPRIWYAAFLAFVIGLELLAAHAQLAYMTLACSIVYALVRLYQVRKHRLRVLRAFLEMLGALLVGILTASVQLLPTLQLFGESTREHLKWFEANRFVMLPKQVVNFIFPNFFGSPVSGDYWGSGNKWETYVYVGIIPLILAIFAGVCASKRRAVWFFIAIGLISLFLSMGRFGGVYWIAYYVVPGTASFHDPARFMFLTTFSLAVLAGIGMRVLRDRGITIVWRNAVVAAAGANLIVYSASFNPSVPPSALAYRPRVLADVPAAGSGRVYTSHRQDVWSRFVNYADYGPDSARYVHELADTLTPNVGMRFGVEEASGYEPVPIKAITELDGLIQRAVDRQSPRLPTYLRLFNANSLLLPQNTRYPHPGLTRKPARGVSLYFNGTNEREWLVERTRRVDGSQRSLSAVSSSEFDPMSEAVVSGSPGLGEGGGGTGRSQIGYVKMIKQRPGWVQMESVCTTYRAFLVRSVAYYPGWKATLDGNPIQIERTNHAFQGVVVAKGRHTIVFSFEPFVFRLGLFLSLVAGGTIAFAFTLGLLVRYR